MLVVIIISWLVREARHLRRESVAEHFQNLFQILIGHLLHLFRLHLCGRCLDLLLLRLRGAQIRHRVFC